MIDPAILDRAADWLSLSFDRALPPARQAELDAWLAADPLHARAYAEMRATWALMGAVEAPAVPRRRWALPALAACLALAALGLAQDWPTRLRADAMTATGERRTMRLPDGSELTLDTHSAVALDFHDGRRTVRLLEGRAAFHVAADPRHPFTVEAADGATTALGTRFIVRRRGDGAEVSVTEHRVRVALGGSETVLGEDQALAYDAHRIGPAHRAVGADAWTDGMLMVDDAPLRDVVAEIGRYQCGYAGVVGHAGDMRVSGVFRVDDPAAALDRLGAAFGLRVTRVGGCLTVIHA
jgi:transmembrane sensor